MLKQSRPQEDPTFRELTSEQHYMAEWVMTHGMSHHGHQQMSWPTGGSNVP